MPELHMELEDPGSSSVPNSPAPADGAGCRNPDAPPSTLLPRTVLLPLSRVASRWSLSISHSSSLYLLPPTMAKRCRAQAKVAVPCSDNAQRVVGWVRMRKSPLRRSCQIGREVAALFTPQPLQNLTCGISASPARWPLLPEYCCCICGGLQGDGDCGIWYWSEPGG